MNVRRRRATAGGLAIALAGLLAFAALVVAAGGGPGARQPESRLLSPTETSTLGVVNGAGPQRAGASNAPLPRGGRTALAMAMHHWLAQAGPASGVLVSLTGSGQVVYARNASVARPPASVEKLYTSAALLQRFGPDYRLHTDVLGTGHLGPGGVWHGDLYLRGDGDPTFGSTAFNRIWIRGQGSTTEGLAAELAHVGIRRVSGRVIADASLFDARRGGPGSGYRADLSDLAGELSALTYDHGAAIPPAPEIIAVQALTSALRQTGTAARPAPTAGVTPPGATPLATVSSPPLSSLLRLMDVSSDDLYAELLTKGLGARFAHAGTISAGAEVISRTVSAYGVHPTIIDGSGLSHRNRTSPAEVVRLLLETSGTSLGRTLRSALPVVGRTGTVRQIGAGTPAAGRCEAKTGTLDAVTNLAGFCLAGGEHQVIFSVFIDGQPDARGYQLLGRMVGDIARFDPTLP